MNVCGSSGIVPLRSPFVKQTIWPGSCNRNQCSIALGPRFVGFQ
jgi:hypothetical protein